MAIDDRALARHLAHRRGVLVFLGPGGLITGPAALANYPIRGPEARVVDVLVPAASKRSAAFFVVIHRTWRTPRVAICVRGQTDRGVRAGDQKCPSGEFAHSPVLGW